MDVQGKLKSDVATYQQKALSTIVEQFTKVML